MIRVAANANPAGLVKFQLYNAADDRGKPHYEWVKAHELGFDDAKMLFDYGRAYGQEVFFSVFGVKYVEWGERIGVKRYKLAYGVDNEIAYAAICTGKPYWWSGHNMYCVPKYPAALADLHFTGDWEGYSDHTIGVAAPMLAISRGIGVVEKHFCLAHNPASPDDAWSMTPDELRKLAMWETVCREVNG